MGAKKPVLRLLWFFIPTKRFLKERLLALVVAICFALLSGLHAYFGLSPAPVFAGVLGFFSGWLLSFRLALIMGATSYVLASLISIGQGQGVSLSMNIYSTPQV